MIRIHVVLITVYRVHKRVTPMAPGEHGPDAQASLAVGPAVREIGNPVPPGVAGERIAWVAGGSRVTSRHDLGDETDLELDRVDLDVGCERVAPEPCDTLADLLACGVRNATVGLDAISAGTVPKLRRLVRKQNLCVEPQSRDDLWPGAGVDLFVAEEGLRRTEPDR